MIGGGIRVGIREKTGAAGDGARSGIYNVGSGTATTFNEIIDLLNDALGTDFEPEYFDNPYAFYQDYTCADLQATTAGLGWEPRYPSQEAIREYATWLKRTAGRQEQVACV